MKPLSMLSIVCLVACKEAPPAGQDTDGGEVAMNDADGDDILDIHEGEDDADADGDANFQDLDSDGDGIADRVEAGDTDLLTFPVDSDGDSDADFLDLDSDGNCVTDTAERPTGTDIADTDGDGSPDFRDDDNDGDTIPDTVEIGANCVERNTDGGDMPDYMDTDSDNDGVGDLFEAGSQGENPIDSDGDGLPDYVDLDSDGDGLSDDLEGGVSGAMDEPRDIDGDGTYDFQDTDADGDGIPDASEATYGTDPFDADTDGDGYSDGAELAGESDPLDGDSVVDGLTVVVPERENVEAPFEFQLRIQEGDIAMLLDTTCSMSSTAGAMAGEFAAIVNEVLDVVPFAKFGFATYDDYNYGGYGSGLDKPFELRQQMTDDYGAVEDVLSAIAIHSGNDWEESSMEALLQGATGIGYDQDCDGIYDSGDDVKPFIADKSDPFGGGSGQFYNPIDDSTGELGGFGFNDFALPILLYATDAPLRDPENGSGTPGGCPDDAGFSDVVAGVAELKAYLIGVAAQADAGKPQMEDLAEATGSYADMDGDGVADRLVLSWSGSDDEFRQSVVDAIADLVNSIKFEKVSLAIEGDEWGFVYAIDPPYYDGFEPEDSGEWVTFTLTFRGMVAATSNDQTFNLKLIVLGDDSIALDREEIVVVVPGTSY